MYHTASLNCSAAIYQLLDKKMCLCPSSNFRTLPSTLFNSVIFNFPANLQLSVTIFARAEVDFINDRVLTWVFGHDLAIAVDESSTLAN